MMRVAFTVVLLSNFFFSVSHDRLVTTRASFLTLGTPHYIVPHTQSREGKEGGKRLIENPNNERELGRERRGKLRNK